MLTAAHRKQLESLAHHMLSGGRLSLFEDISDADSDFWIYGYLKLGSPTKEREEGILFQLRKGEDRKKFLSMAQEAGELFSATMRRLREQANGHVVPKGTRKAPKKSS